MAAGAPFVPDAVQQLRTTLWHHGYRVLPVLNAKRGDKTSGKMPLGGKWQLGAQEDPPQCIRLGAVAWALNTGIACAGMRAIDIDIDDPAMAGAVRVLAQTMLGATIVRTRENSPRCLLVYRAAEGEPTKIPLTGAAHTESNACKIEVLGKGQQFVAYGGHWTGVDLDWLDGGPAERDLASCPAVSEALIHRFLNAAAPLIDAKPIELTRVKKPSARKGNGHDPEGPPTAELRDIMAALALVPNAEAPDWETWNNVGLAIYAATEGSEAGWQLWRDWSAKNPVDDPDATLGRWEHYATSPPDRTGAGKLFALAGKASPGWRRPSTLGAGRTTGPTARQNQPELPIQPPVQPPPPPPGSGLDDEVPGDDGPGDDWEGAHPASEVTLDPDALITEQYAMRVFIRDNHEVLRFNHDTSLWLIWSAHFWKPDQRRLAFSWSMNLCRLLAGTIEGRGRDGNRRTVEKVGFSASVERGARAMPEVSTAQADWDNDPWLLGTPGGVVNLKTAELREGQRGDMISRLTSVTPSVMPDCPTWDAFLDFAMRGDDKLVRFLQRYFGYCLTGVVSEEVFLFLFGQGGAGKGTLVETIAYILGDYASTVPMEVFTGQSWSPTEYYRASMAGQRLVIANEPEQNSKWAEAFIKETTGGDTLSGRHPMGRPFRFRPSHKMAMQGNHMPRLKGRSSGMERRLRIMPFTRLPEVPDRALKAKLLAEAPGILRWLIEGCLAWQNIGLAPPDAVLTANNRYFEAQDNFARWVEDWCILDRYAEHTPSDLRKSFNDWAKQNGEDEMNGNSFAEAIDQFVSDPPIERGKYGKKGRWVKGIRITHDANAGRWQSP